jgi:hypothetical protein
LRLTEWLSTQEVVGLSEQFAFEDYHEIIDLHVEGTFWKVSDKVETQDLVYLAMVAWFAGLDIRSVGVFVPIEGKLYTINLPPGWNEKALRLFTCAQKVSS